MLLSKLYVVLWPGSTGHTNRHNKNTDHCFDKIFLCTFILIQWNSAITRTTGPSKSPRYSRGLVIAEVLIFTGK